MTWGKCSHYIKWERRLEYVPVSYTSFTHTQETEEYP